MHGKGPMLVTAGPGSGKTTVITYRIHHLIHSMGVSPEQILVITFTKAAAKQMRERFISLMGGVSIPVCFSTFHAFFYRLLTEEYSFNPISIITEYEKKALLSDIVKSEGILFPEKELLEELIRQFSVLKNKDGLLCEYEPLYFEKSFFEKVYSEYGEQLKNLGKVDFDDLMLECLTLLKKDQKVLKRWQEQFVYYLIDEFQDINPIQFEIIMLLAKKYGNIFCVGDEDQAIYGFRGASPGLMFHFLKCFPNARHIMMTANYRSKSGIVTAANRIIEKNIERFDKNSFAVKKETHESVTLSKFTSVSEQYKDVAEKIENLLVHTSAKNIAILFRTNNISQNLLDILSAKKISVSLSSVFITIADEEITRDICAYLELAAGNNLCKHLIRIMNKPVRYISKKYFSGEQFSWEKLEQNVSDKIYIREQIKILRKQILFIKDLPLYAAIQYIRKGIGYELYALEKAGERRTKVERLFEEIQTTVKEFETYGEWKEHLNFMKESVQKTRTEQENCISLVTMHASKGLEWDYVFIPDVIDGNLPFHKAKTTSQMEEERRIFYVAMTRAKEHLYISSVINKNLEYNPSVYFTELVL